MKYYLILFVLFTALCTAEAGNEQRYAVSTIAAALRDKAHAVIRRDETVFTVEAINRAKLRYLRAVTVFDERGKNEAVLQVFYDKLIRVEWVKGHLYDASGREVLELKKADIADLSAISNFSLYEDNRYKLARFNYQDYPYTVEFEYELSYDGLMFFPVWRPQDDVEIPVESSLLKICSPGSLPVRYREMNLPPEQRMVKGSEDGKISYLWQAKNIGITKTEPFSRPTDYAPVVYTAPHQFSIEGYSGNMSTWQEFGNWVNQLNAGRDQLPEPIKSKVAQITASTPDQIERIRKLYEYMQETTRYVSIQLGIGGWQPFPAAHVANNGYGDCKALSNYMHSLLKEAGIPSLYTLVRAGREARDLDRSFSAPRFNHAILCVPVAADTIWLECTSQTESFGYLGSFTGDRDVLLITPSGGKVAHTRVYHKMDNQMIRTAVVKMDDTGNASAVVSTHTTGLQQEERSHVAQEAPDEQKKWLYEDTQIANFEITSFSMTRQKGRVPAVDEKMNLQIRKLASKSGSRLFLSPNLLSRWTDVPEEMPSRKTPVHLAHGYYDSDTIRFEVPENYVLEFQPETMDYKSRFGQYHAEVKMTGNVITYIRTVSMNGGTHPKETYAELVEFMKNIVKSDKLKLVLVNKT